MKSIQSFNALDGTVVTRKKLQTIAQIARKERQQHIWQRIETMLKAHPGTNTFDIELDEKIKGLGLPKKFPIKIGKIGKPLINNDEVPSGNVYLEKGDDKYGHEHILKRHGEQLRKANKTAVDFGKWILDNFTEIYYIPKNDTYLVCVSISSKRSDKVLCLALKIKKAKNYYTVISEGWKEKKFFANKKPLWQRTLLPPNALSGPEQNFDSMLNSVNAISTYPQVVPKEVSKDKDTKKPLNKPNSNFPGLGLPFLYGMEHIQDEDGPGLGKPVSQEEIYNYVTDLIINTIKEVGHLPWQKSWVGSGSDGEAKNYVTKKPYSGINWVLLNFDIKTKKDGTAYLVPSKLKQPYYLTFNQIKETGAKLKKGSHARRVLYYMTVFAFDDGTLKFRSADKDKVLDFIKENKLPDEKAKEIFTIPIVKYYNVYRADDCTGLEFPKPKPAKKVNPIEQAQAIIDNYPNHPKYIFIGSQPAYYPQTDKIKMPKITAFNKEESYYSIFFHEITHSTGHSKRLNRGNDTRKRDGSKEDKKAYAFEELVAELGAVFLCSEAGILFSTIKDSAIYLKGWNSRLISELENDNRFFLKASAQAQKAVNHILDRDNETKTAKKVTEKPKKVARLSEKYSYDEILKQKNNVLDQLDRSKEGHIARNFIEDLTQKSHDDLALRNDLGDWLSGKTKSLKLKELLGKAGYKDTLAHYNAYAMLDSTVRKQKKVEPGKGVEKPTPAGFANKPKSISVEAAVDDVLTLPKFKGLKHMQADFLYDNFNGKKEGFLFESYDKNHVRIGKNIPEKFAIVIYDPETVWSSAYISIKLTGLGLDFIKAVNGRLYSLRNQKHNYALFDGLAAPHPYFKTAKEAKKYFLEWARKHLLGKSVYHEELGKRVHFNMKGIDHAISSKLTITKASLITQAKEMLENSKLIKTETDKKNRKEIKAVYRLLSTAQIENELQEVIITLREGENGTIYYDHKIEELKKLSSPSIGRQRPTVCGSKIASSAKAQSKPTKKSTNHKKKLGALVIDVGTTQQHAAGTDNEGLVPGASLGNPQTYSVQAPPPAPAPRPRKTVPTPKGVLSSDDIMGMEFDTLRFEGEWAEFMDSPAKNMRIAIWGKPKNGKTAGATKFANHLTQFGSVLYNFADQGVNKSTRDLWRMSGLADKPNVFLTATRELDELEKLCATGKYDFVVIDMVNTYIHRTGIKYFEFEDRFLKAFPNISFILIFEVTKSGDFRGDQGWTHIVDALVTVEDFVMENQGRYGVGHYIVWQEGLAKVNPRKHELYFGAANELPQTLII